MADLTALPTTLRIDAIVNLAGAIILALPWTAARRQVLRESRIATRHAIVALCARLRARPEVLVSGSASAIGYHGVRDGEALDERAQPQAIFESQLCSDWEAAATAARCRSSRAPCGWVWAPSSAAGDRGRRGFTSTTRCASFLFALDSPALAGPVNAVAPEFTTHAQMQKALGRVLHRPIWLRVPAFVLRSGLGEMAQLLVDGQHVILGAALAAGFEFRHPRLGPALEDLLRPTSGLRP